MEDGKISVIVPVYGVENYLERCVDSIRNQTYRNLEIILVDDGSPDRCPEMCEALAAEDERIVVLHKENGGLSSARNAGLDIATGDYVGFVDSDDWIGPESYEHLIGAMEDGVQIVVGGMGTCEKEGELIDRYCFDRQERCSGEGALLKMLYSPRRDQRGNNWPHMPHIIMCNKLYRRELWRDVRFENIVSEDLPAMFQIYKIADQVAYIPELVYYYFQRPGSISHSGDNYEWLRNGVRSVKKMTEYANTKRLVDMCLDMRVIMEFSLLKSAIVANDKRAYWEDRKEFLQCMKANGKTSKGYVIEYKIGLFMLRYLPHLFWAYTRRYTRRKYCKQKVA